MIKPLKGGRDIVCRICSKKATVKHSRAVTCSKECSKELNRKKNLVNGLAFRKKQREGRDARNRKVRAGKRKAVQGKGNNGKTNKTVKQQTGKQYGQRCNSQSV